MLRRREGWHVTVKRVRRLYLLQACKCGSNRHAGADGQVAGRPQQCRGTNEVWSLPAWERVGVLEMSVWAPFELAVVLGLVGLRLSRMTWIDLAVSLINFRHRSSAAKPSDSQIIHDCTVATLEDV